MLIQGRDEVRLAPGDAPPPASPEGPPPASPEGPPPAALEGPAGTASLSERALDAIIMVGGLLCIGVGLLVIAAWFARVSVILTFGSKNPMSFNTALAFAVTGVALVALVRKRPRVALAAGLFDTVLGVMVLAEYVLNRSLGIDQLIVKAYIAPPHVVPGRSASNTAVCLLLVGASLLVWSPWRTRRRPTVLAAAACVVGLIAAVAAFGYATGNPTAYGWWHVSAMAFLTSATLLILAFSLLTAAWRDSQMRQAGLPRWLPMLAGALVLGLAVWQAIVGRAVATERISQGTFTSAATVLGLILGGSAALVVWLAQRAEGRRRVAVATAARRAEADRETRESENRLFQFLDVMPVGVFIASPGGRPYYTSDEGERLLGRGVLPDIGGDDLVESYGIFQAGTNLPYPTRDLPIVRALRGLRTHVDDMEIHKPDGSVASIEVWGRPVYGASGEIDFAIIAINDPSERLAREKIIAGQAALLELAYDAIFVRDLDGRITYWNASAEHAYGFTRAEAVGQIARDMLRTQFPEPLASIEAIASERGRWEGELTHRCANGQSIIAESRWAAQLGPGGSLLGFMAINRDITSRQDAEREALRRTAEIQALNASLEQRVQERTVHLDRANKHLTAFTYSVAHDLRTPLRGISGFTEALVEEYGDRLDETGLGYAERIEAASGRMATVLDDLLHLSWVSRAEMDLQDVDLSAEVTAICERLRARDPGRRVRVTVEDGVRATVDLTLIRTALEMLLDNAWKFTAGREDATIEFAAAQVDEAPLCCYVRDNGAGFDPAYADKLFQPFQRLHAVGEFPGAGIGLASVQRIIDRHGGRVWAEGAVGRGATFYFTLDAKDTLMYDQPVRLAEGSPEAALPWRVNPDSQPRSAL
jgi:PAS domain S-box-containing protein